MASFFVIEIEKIINQSSYQKYLSQVHSIVQRYNGEYVLKSGKVIPFTGNWKPIKIIIIKFPSIEQLRLCFDSKEYNEIKKYREMSIKGKAIILEN